MKYKFLILIIAVCILDVNSWPQRGGHSRGRGNRDPEVAEQDNERNDGEDKGSKEENSGNERRHRPGLLTSFFEPGQLPHLHQAIREGLNIPGRIIGKNGLFGGRGGGRDRPNRPYEHSKPDSNSEKASSTTQSTSTTAESKKPSSTTSSPTSKAPSSTTSSTPKELETNPPEFTFKLPTGDNFDLDHKGPTTEKPGNQMNDLNNRRLINAPDRCQDDVAGNCREVF